MVVINLYIMFHPDTTVKRGQLVLSTVLQVPPVREVVINTPQCAGLAPTALAEQVLVLPAPRQVLNVIRGPQVAVLVATTPTKAVTDGRDASTVLRATIATERQPHKLAPPVLGLRVHRQRHLVVLLVTTALTQRGQIKLDAP